MALSPLNQRRWRNFKANKRAYWSLIVFSILYILSLGAELLANDRPLMVSYRGEISFPFLAFHSEQRHLSPAARNQCAGRSRHTSDPTGYRSPAR